MIIRRIRISRLLWRFSFSVLRCWVLGAGWWLCCGYAPAPKQASAQVLMPCTATSQHRYTALFEGGDGPALPGCCRNIPQPAQGTFRPVGLGNRRLAVSTAGPNQRSLRPYPNRSITAAQKTIHTTRQQPAPRRATPQPAQGAFRPVGLGNRRLAVSTAGPNQRSLRPCSDRPITAAQKTIHTTRQQPATGGPKSPQTRTRCIQAGRGRATGV